MQALLGALLLLGTIYVVQGLQCNSCLEDDYSGCTGSNLVTCSSPDHRCMAVVKKRKDDRIKVEQKCVDPGDSCCSDLGCKGGCGEGVQICYLCCDSDGCNLDFSNLTALVDISSTSCSSKSSSKTSSKSKSKSGSKSAKSGSGSGESEDDGWFIDDVDRRCTSGQATPSDYCSHYTILVLLVAATLFVWKK